jgi:hypothetical protein
MAKFLVILSTIALIATGELKIVQLLEKNVQSELIIKIKMFKK